MSSPKFTALYPRYPTPNSFINNHSSVKQHLNHSSSPSCEDKPSDITQTSEEIHQINSQISQLQQILNHQCSFCDSLMPVLHLYDYGMSIARYEQMIKSMNKSLGAIGQEIKNGSNKEGGKDEIRHKRQGVNEIYLYDNSKFGQNDQGDQEKEMNQRIEKLKEKIRVLSVSSTKKNKCEEIENRKGVEKIQKQPQIFTDLLQQFRDKTTKAVAQFRNKLLLEESKMLLNNIPQPTLNLTTQNQQMASSLIHQHLYQNIYRSHKQQTAALKLDTSFLIPRLAHPSTSHSIIEAIIEQTEQFHNFNYNRIGQELVDLNKQMEALLGQQIQSLSYKNLGVKLKQREKMCEALELFKIKMRLLDWQIKGLSKKVYRELTKCYNILGEERLQIKERQPSPKQQEEGRKKEHKSLYEELINFPVGGKDLQKNSKQISPKLLQLQNYEYKVQNYQTIFAKDILTLQDIYQTVQDKHEALSNQMQSSRGEQVTISEQESSPSISKGPEDHQLQHSIIISESLHKQENTDPKLAKSRRKLHICSTTQLKLTSPKNNEDNGYYRKDESIRFCSEFSPPQKSKEIIHLGRTTSKKEIKIEREEQRMDSAHKYHKQRKMKLNVHKTANLIPKNQTKKC